MDKLVSVKKPHHRMCPRCLSHNTKLCCIVDSSRQRYTCKHCLRCWTHGGALRNIQIGGRGHNTRRPKIYQPSVSQVNYVENHFGSLSLVLALPAQSAPPMDGMNISDGSSYQVYHDVGSNGANQEDPNKRNQNNNINNNI